MVDFEYSLEDMLVQQEGMAMNIYGQTTHHDVKEFEIVNHGVHHEQYFQGCGVSFTNYDFAYTGAGSTYKEALNNAIDQMVELFIIPADLEQQYEQANDDNSDILYFDEEKKDSFFKEDYYYYATVLVSKY